MSVQDKAQTPPVASIRSVPRTVIALGVVSLFMDFSSEIIHSLLPVFLVTVLGASALSVGLIEGIAEAATPITRLFSGAISDWVGKRKPLILLGYGLAALTKPLFPLASGIGLVLVARFADRTGKGIRGAPRDALIGDVTPVELRGAAFGLRQAMDTVGAFLGPLLAMLLMIGSSDNFRLVFWMAVAPAIVSVLVILYGVQEPDAQAMSKRRPFPIQRSELRRLDLAYWLLVGIAAVLTLGRFSEAFLLLAATQVGVAVALIPGVLVTMNMVYAASAYPFGRFSDAVSRRMLLALGRCS
jgi:Na+/melibiose symporter-like transporter